MIKIGDFSKLSRVSVRMLRHYDEIGLLKPAMTDTFTDYRYYREDQLPTVCRITAFKDMGFSLAEIARLLPLIDDKAALASAFDGKKAELIEQYREAERRLTLLETAEKRLRKEQSMTYSVTLKTIPERFAATVRMIIPTYEDEGMAWGILNEETAGMNLQPDDPCLCAATFFDDEYKETDIDVEVSKTVKGQYADTEHVVFRTLPAVTVASCTFGGGYEHTNDAVAAITEWITHSGYSFAGPMFNIYHVSPHETANSEEFVTEVCFPVAK